MAEDALHGPDHSDSFLSQLSSIEIHEIFGLVQEEPPSISLCVTCQPVTTCRVRYRQEIADFQQRSAPATCGSRLRGRCGGRQQQQASHVTLCLTASWRVSGRLLGLPVDCQDNPVRLHMYDLYGSDCHNGLYDKRVELLAHTPQHVMLINVGLVKCKVREQSGQKDTKASVLEGLFNSQATNCLFRTVEGGGGPLATDVADASESCLRILFVFIPDHGHPSGAALVIPLAFTEPIECAAGAAGGRSGLQVCDQTPNVVLLRSTDDSHGDFSVATEDVWLQLDCEIKVQSEQLYAQLTLPGIENQPGVPLNVPIETQRNFVKLLLTKLPPTRVTQDERISAELVLTKLANRSGAAAAAASETRLDLIFRRLEQPPSKRRRLASSADILDDLMSS